MPLIFKASFTHNFCLKIFGNFWETIISFHLRPCGNQHDNLYLNAPIFLNSLTYLIVHFYLLDKDLFDLT
jgi:hypothetical protein